MSEPLSLFNELKQGGYDACLVSTFSIDFPFYEDVLLRRMQSSGINHHMLFVDKGMCLSSMAERPPVKAGTHYVLAPMDCPRAFHPKLLLLLGKNKGLLAVGSHNLTLSGFGQNLEITNVIRFTKNTDEEFLTVFQIAFRAFREWLDGYGTALPATATDALERTLHLSPWLNSEETAGGQDECDLLFTSSVSVGLWEQLKDYIPDTVQQIIGMSAFFDRKLAFVSQLKSLTHSAPIIAVQPDTVSAPDALLNDPDLKIVDVNAVDKISLGKSYVHAKIIYIQGEQDLFVSGSANLSSPAWTDSTERRNAEAVLVLHGQHATEVVKELALNDLMDAPPVKKITAPDMPSTELASMSVELLIVEDTGEANILIPKKSDWGESIVLGYQNMLGEQDSIEYKQKDGSWVINRDALHEGEVICVFKQSDILARIVLLNTPQIRNNSSAGKERRLQQVLGTLNSDNPEIDLLFRCFDQMIPRNIDFKGTKSTKNTKQGPKPEDDEPETLLADLSVENIRRASSGRHRCSGGDIGLVLDMFIYNLGSLNRRDSTKAFGEDELGRNEEDLIGSDDNFKPPKPEPGKAAELENIDKLCRNKIATIMKRLDAQLGKTNSLKHEQLKTMVPVTLATLVLIHELYSAQKDRHWVVQQVFSDLCETVFVKLFSEKMPIELDVSSENAEDSIYHSDEWAQLLGYATWIAFQNNIVLQARLPLSAIKEGKDLLRWKNACWLFLSQRISADDMSANVANRLLSQEGGNAEGWFSALSKAGKQISTEQRLPMTTGFGLASSPKKTFEGYKLVTYADNDWVVLAGINAKDKPARFKQGFLNVVEG